MELAADVADPLDERPLDVHVDVFQLLAELELAGGDFVADLLEAGDDLVPLVVGQDAHLGEHVGVGDRAADIVGVQAAVEAHAFGELLDATVRRLVKYSAPRLIGQCLPPRDCLALCCQLPRFVAAREAEWPLR